MNMLSSTVPSESFDSRLTFLNYGNITYVRSHRDPGRSFDNVLFFDTQVMYQENRVSRGGMLLTAVTSNLQFYEVHIDTTLPPLC